MRATQLPQTDSIQDLAKFWDEHEITDFEAELEEVSSPVFVREATVQLHLTIEDVKALKRLASKKGVSHESLVREWVLEQLRAA